MTDQDILAALRAALKEIEATGQAEGTFYADDPHVEDQLHAAIAEMERRCNA